MVAGTGVIDMPSLLQTDGKDFRLFDDTICGILLCVDTEFVSIEKGKGRKQFKCKIVFAF